MKAAVFYEPYNIKVVDVDIPSISSYELLVKVEVAAVCGTDLRIYEGEKTKGVRKSSILGHEIVGIVKDAGTNVEDFKIGDRVGIIPVITCGKCHYCLNNKENICLNRTAIGYEFDGGFAEYIRIPEIALQRGNLIKLPPNLSFKNAVLIEPLGCCINGQKNAKVKMGDVVVIIGGGPIGLIHIQLAKIAGAQKIILSEPIEHRREKGLLAGATHAINPNSENLEEIILKESNGLGADVIITAIGIPNLINDILKYLKKDGNLNLFAGFSHDAQSLIDPNLIHYGEINISGASSLKRSDYLLGMQLLSNKQINTEIISSYGYQLKDIEQAIEDTKNGTGMKSIISF